MKLILQNKKSRSQSENVIINKTHRQFFLKVIYVPHYILSVKSSHLKYIPKEKDIVREREREPKKPIQKCFPKDLWPVQTNAFSLYHPSSVDSRALLPNELSHITYRGWFNILPSPM